MPPLLPAAGEQCHHFYQQQVRNATTSTSSRWAMPPLLPAAGEQCHHFYQQQMRNATTSTSSRWAMPPLLLAVSEQCHNVEKTTSTKALILYCSIQWAMSPILLSSNEYVILYFLTFNNNMQVSRKTVLFPLFFEQCLPFFTSCTGSMVSHPHLCRLSVLSGAMEALSLIGDFFSHFIHLLLRTVNWNWFIDCAGGRGCDGPRGSARLRGRPRGARVTQIPLDVDYR